MTPTATRTLWLAAVLIACGGPPPPRAAPPGPAACARAADNLVLVLLARLPASDASPTEAADGLRNLIRERCEADGWSAEATRCLIAMKQQADAEPCAALMTPAQQAALVHDQQARGAAPPP